MFHLLKISLTFLLSCSIVSGASYSALSAGVGASQPDSKQIKDLDEAERNGFITRRIVLCCWTSIRDQEIRKRVALMEGDIFKRRALERSLEQLSRFEAVEPVQLADVDVRINREEKTIDFIIHIKERRDAH